MPSIQAKMISGLFNLIGVNRMLDKQGADFEKLLDLRRLHPSAGSRRLMSSTGPEKS